ncbi:3-beta hydroxysteroid dehydrogenase (NAD dependent epimerase/dehydratase) [Pleurostoma richardsiae]|uniref:3-beta hydroxysteroid dehydrogenase (NAD dependent epimerase/dehydratase) n=1 Tax=Pleurostoma richardsiae TaxID=41990 RepID=A0AA38RJQ1_9PEZI|nr:3-beta hydroxysteroid dehydrogenase (NAD dependent epimerase/dehydratase) [Pleurostoma richardsiae]
MARPSDLVLITGATGHVGSCTLLHLLRAGHRVRAAVRSEKKAAAVLARPAIQALRPGSRLTFVIVPDITAPGAYERAVDGVTHVIHIASPLATGDAVPLDRHVEHFIRPAVRGTREMLEAAAGSGTVRRVVITSSITAIVPVAQMEGTAPRLTAVRPTDRVPCIPDPYESEFAAYAASKVAALQEAEAWIARERPAFDVVHLHPSFVLGRNDAAASPGEALRGTNAVLLAMLLGKRFGPFAGATVHVEDVARAHVAALDPRVPGDQSYILSGPARWNDAKEVARRAFPAAMETGLLVGRGNVDSTYLPIDSSLTEATFGLGWAGFEEQVVSTVGQFLELRMRQRGSSSQGLPARVKRKEVLSQVSANA